MNNDKPNAIKSFLGPQVNQNGEDDDIFDLKYFNDTADDVLSHFHSEHLLCCDQSTICSSSEIQNGFLDIDEDSINKSIALKASNRAESSIDFTTSSVEKDPLITSAMLQYFLYHPITTNFLHQNKKSFGTSKKRLTKESQ